MKVVCECNCMSKMKIAEDFNKSENEFQNIGLNNITILGSARTSDDNKYSLAAEELATNLSNLNFNIISGGGNGIMKAANKGAFESKNPNSLSIGMSILLPHEQHTNPYTHKSFVFNYFFSRKYMLIKHSKACVVFPGGYGTLDELFEVLTLVQTGIMQKNFKIFLYDIEYWTPLLTFIKSSLLKNQMIDKKDLDLFELSNNIKYIESKIEEL